MARDELAEKICAMLLANPMGYLYGDIGLLPNFMMDVIFDMVDKGPQRLRTTGTDGVVAKALSHLYFVDKRDWNDCKNTGTQTFALPKELIEAFSDNMDAIEALRNFGDDLELYANAAVILYGVVSLTSAITPFMIPCMVYSMVTVLARLLKNCSLP